MGAGQPPSTSSSGMITVPYSPSWPAPLPSLRVFCSGLTVLLTRLRFSYLIVHSVYHTILSCQFNSFTILAALLPSDLVTCLLRETGQRRLAATAR